MAFLRKLHDIVFPKRYQSAWARQQDERENRWRNHRDVVLKEELRLFANRMRTGKMMVNPLNVIAI